MECPILCRSEGKDTREGRFLSWTPLGWVLWLVLLLVVTILDCLMPDSLESNHSVVVNLVSNLLRGDPRRVGFPQNWVS